MMHRLYYSIIFILLWSSNSIELFPFSPVTKLQITSDFSCQDSLREFVYSDMPSNQKNLEQGLSAQEIPVQQSVCGARRTKEYEEAAVQQESFEQACSNYIFKKSQEPRCALQLSNGSYLGLVLNRWKSTLRDAQNLGDVELVARLSKRVEVLSKTRISSTRSLYNSDLESLLICEFKDSYTSVKNIAQEHPQNIHAKMALSVLIECADLAFQELDVEAAFSHADFAHDLVTLVQRSITGGIALARGAYHGIKTACSLEHWKQMAHGMLHLVKAACKKGLELADVVTALESCNESHCDKVLSAFQERGAAEHAALQAHLKKSWHTIQKKSWDQLLESGAEMGALMLLDTIMMNGAGYVATTAGRTFVSEAATIFKQGGAEREAYCAEIAGVGKLVVEKGEAAVLKTVEKQSEASQKLHRCLGEVLAGKIEFEAIKKRIIVASERLKFDLNDSKRWYNKKILYDEQKKVFDEILKKSVRDKADRSVTYNTAGKYKDALLDFERLKLLNVQPLPKKDGLFGVMHDNTVVNVHFNSTDGRPTLEFLKKEISGKKSKPEKFRYGVE